MEGWRARGIPLPEPLLRPQSRARSSSGVSSLSSRQQPQERRETSFSSGRLPLPSEALLGDLAECLSGHQGWRCAQALLWELLGHRLLPKAVGWGFCHLPHEVGAPWGHNRAWVAQWAGVPGSWLCPEPSGWMPAFPQVSKSGSLYIGGRGDVPIWRQRSPSTSLRQWPDPHTPKGGSWVAAEGCSQRDVCAGLGGSFQPQGVPADLVQLQWGLLCHPGPPFFNLPVSAMLAPLPSVSHLGSCEGVAEAVGQSCQWEPWSRGQGV